MIYFRGTKDIHLDHTVVALGKFDGLHRGHQLLINKLKEYGKKGFQTVVFTFDFHPNESADRKETVADLYKRRAASHCGRNGDRCIDRVSLYPGDSAYDA